MNDACYASSTGKIYGTVGPYVCQFNGITGARESFVKVTSPAMGDLRICYHAANDTLYAAVIWQTNSQYANYLFPPVGTPFLSRDVFPVSTGLVVGARINMDSFIDNGPPFGGFQWIGSAGIYLYVVVPNPGYTGSPSDYGLLRFNPSILADRSTSSVATRFRPEHGAFSPTQVALPNAFALANNTQISFAPIGWTVAGNWSDMYVIPHVPCAVEYSTSNAKFYAVCGTTNLLRIDTLTPFPGTFTALNLGTVDAAADPCRIRCSPFDGKLYLPCMTSDIVIVWDPNTETGVAKTGFENPCDVIFTSNKIWAVQNATIGLREVVP